MSADSRRIEKPERRHSVEDFDCGEAALNRFLARFALAGQAAGGSSTYVASEGERIVGYCTLAVGEVEYEDAPERLRKGLARHPVPIMILARLAVSLDRRGEGLGAGLLKDALLRTLAAAEIAGIRAVVVHAKNDAERAFYERFDFLPSPTDPYHLYRLLKDVRSALETP